MLPEALMLVARECGSAIGHTRSTATCLRKYIGGYTTYPMLPDHILRT